MVLLPTMDYTWGSLGGEYMRQEKHRVAAAEVLQSTPCASVPLCEAGTQAEEGKQQQQPYA